MNMSKMYNLLNTLPLLLDSIACIRDKYLSDALLPAGVTGL